MPIFLHNDFNISRGSKIRRTGDNLRNTATAEIKDYQQRFSNVANGWNMVMLNGSAPHMHNITDFKMTGSPTKNGIATTYNGTATVIPVPINGKLVTVSDVPVSIKLMGPRAMSLWIDPTKTDGHFGNTPIYGIQRGMPMMMSMK